MGPTPDQESSLVEYSAADLDRYFNEAYTNQLKPVLMLACIYYFTLAVVHLFVSSDNTGPILAAIVIPIALVSLVGYLLLNSGKLDKAYSHHLAALLAVGLILENYVQIWLTRSPEMISDLLLAIMVFGILSLKRWVFILANGVLFSLLLMVLVWIEEFNRYYDDPYRIVLMVAALLLSTIIFEQRRVATLNQIKLRMIDQARAEHLQRANAAKDRFLASMSHELRTPLNAIMGFGQILQTKPEIDSKNQQILDKIMSASKHLLHLISELLDLSRLQSGNFSVSLEQVAMAPLLSESLGLVAHLKDEQGVVINNHIASETASIAAYTDPVRARQVLVNLLTNAIKYNSTQGSVDISLDHEYTQGLRIKIADTGPGIAETELENLFEPFNRLGRESSAISGTGIGLSISRQIMHRLGGSIGVQSQLGSGAVFWLDFPTSEADAKAGQENQAE